MSQQFQLRMTVNEPKKKPLRFIIVGLSARLHSWVPQLNFGDKILLTFLIQMWMYLTLWFGFPHVKAGKQSEQAWLHFKHHLLKWEPFPFNYYED